MKKLIKVWISHTLILRTLYICWPGNLSKNINRTPKTYIYRQKSVVCILFDFFLQMRARKPTVISQKNLSVRLVSILTVCLLLNRKINSSRLVPIVGIQIHVASICHSCVKPFMKFIFQSLGVFGSIFCYAYSVAKILMNVIPRKRRKLVCVQKKTYPAISIYLYSSVATLTIKRLLTARQTTFPYIIYSNSSQKCRVFIEVLMLADSLP